MTACKLRLGQVTASSITAEVRGNGIDGELHVGGRPGDGDPTASTVNRAADTADSEYGIFVDGTVGVVEFTGDGHIATCNGHAGLWALGLTQQSRSVLGSPTATCTSSAPVATAWNPTVN